MSGEKKPHLDRNRTDQPIRQVTDETLPDPCDLELARPIVQAFSKAIQASRLYPAANPACLRARSAFEDAILAALRKKNSFRLVVERSGLHYSGEPVLEDETESGLALWLHCEGIREITFHQGLEAEQIAQFLILFRDHSGEGKEPGGFSASFWDKALTHITCVVIDELFDPEQDGHTVPAEFGEDFKDQTSVGHYDFSPGTATGEQAMQQADLVLAKVRENDVELFGVSEEDRTAILREIAEEETPERRREAFGRILVEILFLEEDETEFVALTQFITELITSQIEHGKLESVAWLISCLVETEVFEAIRSEVCHRALAETTQSPWSDGNFERIRSQLDQGHPEIVVGLNALVAAIPDADMTHVCLLLGSLETAGARRRLIETLVDRCREKPRILLPYLEDERWYLVRNVALILARIGDRTMGPHLQPLLRHSNMRVRREALAAIDQIDPTRAESLLKDALIDPDARVRIFAAGHLATRGPSASETLLNAILSKDFPNRDDVEIGAFYDALAHVGGVEVVTFLAEVASRRNLFRRKKIDIQRAAAAHALGRAGGPVAQQALHGLRDDRSDLVRASVRSALDQLSAQTERKVA